jgi:hypothetical protein
MIAIATIPSADRSIPFPPRTSADILDEIAFCAWVAQALPGDSIVYYRGHLGDDRMPIARVYPERICRQLAALAGRALALAEDGWIILVQRRLGSADWAYTAVKARSLPRASGARAFINEFLDREAA